MAREFANIALDDVPFFQRFLNGTLTAMLTAEEVLKVAELGRLSLTAAEVEQFTAQLGHILDYVAVLDELDVSHVQPMAHVAEVANVFRADEVGQSLPRDKALANAPRTDGRFFLVPQILENAS